MKMSVPLLLLVALSAASSVLVGTAVSHNLLLAPKRQTKRMPACWRPAAITGGVLSTLACLPPTAALAAPGQQALAAGVVVMSRQELALFLAATAALSSFVAAAVARALAARPRTEELVSEVKWDAVLDTVGKRALKDVQVTADWMAPKAAAMGQEAAALAAEASRAGSFVAADLVNAVLLSALACEVAQFGLVMTVAWLLGLGSAAPPAALAALGPQRVYAAAHLALHSRTLTRPLRLGAELFCLPAALTRVRRRPLLAKRTPLLRTAALIAASPVLLFALLRFANSFIPASSSAPPFGASSGI